MWLEVTRMLINGPSVVHIPVFAAEYGHYCIKDQSNSWCEKHGIVYLFPVCVCVCYITKGS